MELRKLEARLNAFRLAEDLTFRYLAGQGLDQYVVKRIEDGGNYSMQSLLKFVEVLNFYLLIDGHRVFTLEEVGQRLQEARLAAGKTIVGVQKASGLSAMAIRRIEHGLGCRHDSLVKYLKAVSVSFDTEAMYETLV